MNLAPVALLICTLGAGALEAAPPPGGGTFESYRRARLAIDKALQAHGGRERIEALESVSLEYTGLRTMINQSRRALGPWDR
ncbi:MAG: hypothetical protein JNK75_03385, partial [Betaproteobacteria bacterium]|nr:hypothetical protein [Betaproteobacteria bacterium]